MKLVTLDRKALFLEFGLTNLSSDQQDKIWQLLEEIFNLRLLDAILSELALEEQKSFLDLLMRQEEEAAKFIKDKIKDFDALVSMVIADVKKDFAQDVKRAKEGKK
jgi:hypothetical protein